MTTIEKMARAMAYAMHKFYNGDAAEGFVWASLGDDDRAAFMAQSRAALQAIREVPEEISSVAIYDEYDWAGRNFTAMIDAILAEQPEP